MEEKSQMVEEVGSLQTLAVMELAVGTSQETVDWLLKKIRAPAERVDSIGQTGADLKANQVSAEKGKVTVLHIGGTTHRLLEGAELMEIKKEYEDGSLREFAVSDLSHFRHSDDLDHFLTDCEKQKIVLHELKTVRASSEDVHVPGSKIKLYPGEAVIPALLKEDVITKLFPLHDKEMLKRLGFSWYKAFWKPQPLDEIRRYFGESVAMYFAFLGFYTMALIPPAFIGIISALSPTRDVNLQLFFSIFNMVWVTVFLESWKRHCATLAYKWGTIHTEPFEEARAEFYGMLAENKVTGRKEPHYPKWKRLARFYGVSVPVLLVCLVIAFWIMLVYFWLEDHAKVYHKETQTIWSRIILLGPTVLYAVVISVLNAIYRRIAKLLNDWENHRLQSAYNNHLITKLVLFDFMNCFMCLFYIAFYQQDMAYLRSSLAVLLVTQQIIGQLLESVVPYYLYKYRSKHLKAKRGQSRAESGSLLSGNQAEIEATKDQYEARTPHLILDFALQRKSYSGTLDDYLEMFLQFGYVFLFSAVFPSAAFWALLNNITEIRTDAFKLCRIYQRPFAQSCANIGAWQVAFELMSVMAVVTNCALVALSPQVQNYIPDYGMFTVFFWFVIAEHAILFVKLALAYLIPDEPGWVRIKLAKLDYQAKIAWRKERSTKARQHLKNVTGKDSVSAEEKKMD